jgi:hypothetical protein
VRRIAELRADIAQLDAQLEALPLKNSDLDHGAIARRAREGLRRWNGLNADHQRATLQTVIDAVYVWRRDDDAPWRQPYTERIAVVPVPELRPPGYVPPAPTSPRRRQRAS